MFFNFISLVAGDSVLEENELIGDTQNGYQDEYDYPPLGRRPKNFFFLKKLKLFVLKNKTYEKCLTFLIKMIDVKYTWKIDICCIYEYLICG